MAETIHYFISAKRLARDKLHIESVRVHPNTNGHLGAESSWPRQNVIEAIEKQGKVFYTMYKPLGSSEWKLGAKVLVVRVDGTLYLKTKPNNTKADNLDELPDY